MSASIHTMTIEGDRQSGKTEALIRLAVMDAVSSGKRVVWAAPSSPLEAEAFARIERAHAAERVCRTTGRRRIGYRSGGEILFVTVGRGGGRGLSAEVLVLDGVADDAAVDLMPIINGANASMYQSRVSGLNNE